MVGTWPRPHLGKIGPRCVRDCPSPPRSSPSPSECAGQAAPAGTAPGRIVTSRDTGSKVTMAYGQTGRLNTRSGTTEENRVVLFTRRPLPCREWREALGRSNCMPEVAGSIPFARLVFFVMKPVPLATSSKLKARCVFFSLHFDIMEGAHRIVPGFNHSSR